MEEYTFLLLLHIVYKEAECYFLYKVLLCKSMNKVIK